MSSGFFKKFFSKKEVGLSLLEREID